MASLPSQAQTVTVTTWQNDNYRSGENTRESKLLYSTLNKRNFGQLCSTQLDGQVYAQPLISTVNFKGSTQTVAYVVTENDTLYAISGASSNAEKPCTVFASISLSSFLGQYPVDCRYIGAGQCQTIAPYVGILGTPVINGDVLYLVAETQDVQTGQPSHWYHTLFEINTTNLKVIGHVVITPPAGCGGSSNPFSQTHIQRPGLLYADNYLYVAFSMMDGIAPLPNGLVFGYNTAKPTNPPLCFATTPGDASDGGGGVWQSLAYGSDGTGNYLYFDTGNGKWNGNSSFGDSFLKLDPATLTGADYFTPSDQYYRNCVTPGGGNEDLDFGSGGVMLVPDQQVPGWPYLAVSAEKEGKLWVMNRTNPGRFNAGSCSVSGKCVPCNAVNGQAPDNQNIQTVQIMTSNHTAFFHNTPAFGQFNVNGTLQDYIYIAGAFGGLTQYPLCANPALPICNSTGVSTKTGFKNGATPVVTSDSGTQVAPDGIVWAIWGDGSVVPLSGTSKPGVLYAYDALTMSQLYGSNQCSSGVDAIATAIKFSVPTIANGYVYLGAMGPLGGVSGSYNNGMFYIFGSLSRNGC
ncbi:MAG: hypothetical protein WAL32_11325 [Terriglobales bacterium]